MAQTFPKGMMYKVLAPRFKENKIHNSHQASTNRQTTIVDSVPKCSLTVTAAASTKLRSEA
eukprot:756234-Amphidinium_carterae.1